MTINISVSLSMSTGVPIAAAGRFRTAFGVSERKRARF